MAAKVSIQDITDAGFREEQFGTPDDWSAEGTGYLARVISRAEQWARGELGDGLYDAAVAGTVAEHIRSAELCWCSATLWKRRAAFIDSNAVSALGDLAYLDRREFEAQAARAMECAEEAIAAARGDGSGGVLR
jgi:hypothetical protein